jgi:protein involved in polysaccharide export with SLBB domain
MENLRLQRCARTIRPIWLLAVASLAFGCSASPPPPTNQIASGPTATSVNPSGDRQGPDAARLQSILTSREREASDFAIGIGDVLEITVPDIGVLQDQTVRVRGDGAITLPLLGSLQAAGLTEEQLQAVLIDRLHKYLIHPQAEIFVKSYSSRQIAVLGAVQRPGTYTLSGPTDTLRGMLERAGGMTEQAGPEILLTPGSADAQTAPPQAVPNDPRNADQSDPVSSLDKTTQDSNGPGHLVPTSAVSPDPSVVPSAAATNPLMISLAPGSDDRRYLDLPARPGDTIYVPLAGSVSVVGWVQSPRTVPISPGMTVLGAVSAAGGPLFAADTSSVTIYRQAPHGEKSVLTVDLDQVQKRQAADIALRENDVVQVPYSTLRIPGYAFYYAMQGIVSFAPAAAIATGT